MKNKAWMLCLMWCVCCTLIFAQDIKTIWLDEMNVSNGRIGWGDHGVNKTVSGQPLTLNGNVYERGGGREI